MGQNEQFGYWLSKDPNWNFCRSYQWSPARRNHMLAETDSTVNVIEWLICWCHKRPLASTLINDLIADRLMPCSQGWTGTINAPGLLGVATARPTCLQNSTSTPAGVRNYVQNIMYSDYICINICACHKTINVKNNC